MSSQFVENNAYYYVSSDLYGPDIILGENFGSPHTLFLTTPSFSSNNWQIFYQDPIFLIRNYDHGAEYQLGITEDSPTSPGLQPASGELMQQWNITLWDDGTYRLANMWLGSVQMLGVSRNGDGVPVPVMNGAENGSHWSFAINAGVAQLPTDEMLQPVSLEAAPSATSTSGSTVISNTPETTAAATESIVGSLPSSSSSNAASSQPTTSSSLSGGAIAGIVVAIIAAALVVLGLVFFVLRRRRRRHGVWAGQAALAQQHKDPVSTAMHEAYIRSPPSELAGSNERDGMRSRAVEMAT